MRTATPCGHWVVYDEIPRRPERPADYDAYRYPVPCERACVVSGYDLDRSDLISDADVGCARSATGRSIWSRREGRQ